MALDDDRGGGWQRPSERPRPQRKLQAVHVDDVGRERADRPGQIALDEAVLHAVPDPPRIPTKTLDDGHPPGAGGTQRLAPAGEGGVAIQELVRAGQADVPRIVNLRDRDRFERSFHLKRRPLGIYCVGLYCYIYVRNSTRESTMRRTVLLSAVAITSIVLLVGLKVRGQSTGLPKHEERRLDALHGRHARDKYMPLDQINASNFNKLEVAWRFKTDNLARVRNTSSKARRSMVKGVLYTTAGTRRSVVALDAETGEVIWSHSYREGKRAAIAPRQLSGRGVAYWTDGKGDDRVLYVTTGYRLVALNAQDRRDDAVVRRRRHGRPEGGRGDRQGPADRSRDRRNRPALDADRRRSDTVLVGSSFKEGMTARDAQQHQGSGARLRRAHRQAALDVQHDSATGRVRQRHVGKRVVGRPTATPASGRRSRWMRSGSGRICRSKIPTSDYYGGHRPGNNLFGDSIVCVDLKTGQRKWHFQVVHHPIWDYDMSSAPILVDINVDGKPSRPWPCRRKQSFLYVFDRITGKPVWPIEERPVQQSRRARREDFADAAVPDQAAGLLRRHAITETT